MNISSLHFKTDFKYYKSGTVIFKEKDVGKEMYFIRSGTVSIEKRTGEINLKLAKLGAGDFFGELAIVTGEKRMASAVAVNDCRIYPMDKVTFVENLLSDKKFAIRFIEDLSFRLKETDSNLWKNERRIFRLYESFGVTG